MGEIFDEGYELLGEPKKGGMSVVYQAREIATGKIVAIKLCKESTDDWLRSSFEAEHTALKNLSHVNIVKALDVGVTKDHTLYLVLEWVPQTLHDLLLAGRPMPWAHYYVDIGKPILDGLRYAHGRRVAHRDLKPRNILLTSNGLPKIADFGIARHMDKMPGGHTLRGAGSAPYTPPEVDDSIHSLGRDCYSWAVITLSCISGRIFTNLGEVQAALEQLHSKTAPTEAIRRALSLKPEARYVSASELCADVEAFDRRRIQASGQSIPVAVTFTRTSLERCFTAWGVSDADAVRTQVFEDLNEVVAVDVLSQEPVKLLIIGASCVIEGELLSDNPDQILASRVDVLPLSVAERRRDSAAAVPFIHFVDRIQNSEDMRRNIRRVLTYVEGELGRKEQERLKAEKERFFDGLSGYLREKEKHYREQSEAIRFSRFRKDGERWIAVLEREMDVESLGESLIVELPNARPVIFDVLDASLDQVYLRPKIGAPDLVPESGYLKVNRTAELQALGKQRTALELIRDGRAVSPDLGDLLRDLNLAIAPEQSGMPPVKGLSPDKQRVLEKALGVVQFLVVEGPPGTGKTTLIAELIFQYLLRYPARRILLSSQTHVALDHVITKLKEKGMDRDVVRIARGQEGKVDPNAAGLLLGRKVEEWARRAEDRSRQFVDEFARRSNLDSREFRAGVLGIERLRRMERVRLIDIEIGDLQLKQQRIDEDRKSKVQRVEPLNVDEIVTATSTLADQVIVLKEERDQHVNADQRIGSMLRTLGGSGEEMVAAEQSKVLEKANKLLIATPEGTLLRNVIELQHKWLERLGASHEFYPAVLKEARVVAGTCVGLAGVQAIYDDEYDLCIVDEASKATATETLIPMSRGRAWLLVGDPKQLPPYMEAGLAIKVEGYRDDEINRTLLDYTLTKLPKHSQESLSEQHRMVRGIGGLVSVVFYESRLTSTREDKERVGSIAKIFPKPVTWISTSRLRSFDHRASSGSYRNQTEADIVAAVMRQLNHEHRQYKKKLTVAVIAGYAAQVRLIKDGLGAIPGGLPHLEVECNTVDAFQGRDADVCIYSVTRSNRENRLGFQKQKPRLNVALSRARDALVIVGDKTFCKACPGENPFPPVIDYLEQNEQTCEIRDYVRR